jgi:2-polyprenyl-3-methyl-5-hydroxy-6-metoxy-1,4-benzoquinol methylase
MAGSLTSVAQRLRSWFWSAWRGHGKPQPLEVWDRQYKAGEWDYLDGLEESDRYSVIIGYIRHCFTRAEILDVGCGHGRLLALLHPSWFSRYTGVDVCQEAIDRASRLNVSNATFVTDDLEQWAPPDPVDVIVFNESLYHARNPAAIVSRYAPALKPGGKIIVSMHEGGNHQIIWRKLDSALRRVHGVHLHSDAGPKWTVRIFDPPPKALIPL